MTIEMTHPDIHGRPVIGAVDEQQATHLETLGWVRVDPDGDVFVAPQAPDQLDDTDVELPDEE